MRKTLTTTLMLALVVLSASAAMAGWEEGVAAFKSGDYTSAASEFQKFVDERPDVYQGHYMLGQVLSKLGRNQEALTHLRKAYELEPGNVGVQLVLGKAYLDSGRYGDAVGILGKINSASLPKAQQTALHQMMARALEKTGDSDRAAAELAAAAQLAPNDASVQFQYGAAALKTGDTDAAVRALAKATSLDSSNADAQKAYAQALLVQGRSATGAAKAAAYGKAVDASKKVVAKDPSYDNLMLLAGAQLGAKQYQGAESTAQQAAAKNSSDWLPLYYMGQAQTLTEKFSAAESSLKKATSLASSQKDKVTILKQLGFVYEKSKSYDQSIAAYQQAGDGAGVARVQKNKETAEFNRSVEDENRKIQELEAEAAQIEAELQGLPGALNTDDDDGDGR